MLTYECNINQIIRNGISVNFCEIFNEADVYVGLFKSFGFYDAVRILIFSTDWMKMDLDFTNKKVLVTGAGKGTVLDFVCLLIGV